MIEVTCSSLGVPKRLAYTDTMLLLPQPPGLEDILRVHWVIGPVEESDAEIPAAGEGEISFLLEGNTTGWLGFSFAESPTDMFPADAVVGWVADGNATIKAYRVLVRLCALVATTPRSVDSGIIDWCID